MLQLRVPSEGNQCADNDQLEPVGSKVTHLHYRVSDLQEQDRSARQNRGQKDEHHKRHLEDIFEILGALAYLVKALLGHFVDDIDDYAVGALVLLGE